MPSSTTIRGGALSPLPGVHVRPMYRVIYSGSWRRRSADWSAHLGVGFALRCVQRFSTPDIAIRRWPGQANRLTSGRAAPVLSYWERRPATLQRPRRIETELSHDVLNPARVPL